jgi:hypothetical protein
LGDYSELAPHWTPRSARVWRRLDILHAWIGGSGLVLLAVDLALWWLG